MLNRCFCRLAVFAALLLATVAVAQDTAVAPAPQAKENTANQLIAKQADGNMVHFLDINAAFLTKDRILTREVMPDLLHPREKGYGIWAEAMEPTIAKLLGEK